MKKLFLGILGAAAVTAVSATPARAATFVTVTDNTTATTVTCTVGGLCQGAPLLSAGNQIIYANLVVGNFVFESLSVTSNAPGTPVSANTSDNKLNVTYNGPGVGSLTVTFGATDFTLPAGSELSLSGSGDQNVLESPGPTTSSFTACGNDANTQAAAGVCVSTALIVAPGGNTAAESADTPDTTFTKSGTFSLIGRESITMTSGGTSSFSGQVIATAVPEPTSLLLLGTGFAGLATRLRRRRRA